MNFRKNFAIFAWIIVLLVIFFSWFFGFLTDWYWFKNLGYQVIFLTTLKVKVFLFLIAGFISFLIIYLNGRVAKRNYKPDLKIIDLGDFFKKNSSKFNLIFSLIAGLFIGLATAGQWEFFLKYFNQVPFNALDPVLGKDISYYFFTLPVVKVLVGLGFWILIFSAVNALLHFIFSKIKSLKTFDRNFFKSSPIKKHFSFLGSLFFLLLGISTFFISIPSLLQSSRGGFKGPGYADIYATWPFLKVLGVLAFLIFIILIINIFKPNKRMVIISLGLFVFVFIFGVQLAPVILQKFIVAPNELVKEAPYLENHIKFTKQAFGLDKIEKRELTGETTLTIQDINDNSSTIKNIRLWDRDPLLDTFGQLQEIRTYYDFVSIDNDRYQLDGDYRQVLLSPRELNSQSLPQLNFINERLTFTHGFGLTLGPVNEVTPEGLPVLFLKDLPPKTEIKDLEITRPEIYYGEIPNDYVIVNTKAKEFDYPAGDENIFTHYQGEGGVKLDSFFKKVMYAIKFGSLKIILSQDITPESRIMYNRDIVTRMEKVFPFLTFDKDPYLVITDDGRLKWVADAYTISDAYPYAQLISQVKTLSLNYPYAEYFNYIRNSVKIVLDAYDGKMDIYLSDPQDPIIQTFANSFKGVFIPLEKMTANLKSHLRYPEDLFNYQTKIYSVYHMDELQIFYNKEDQWEIPYLSNSLKFDPMMRRIILRLPEEEKEEFISMIPFTPRGKDNLAAWMVARNDGENYGELMVYRFPKQKLVYGPKQITNRINQDTNISQQLTLWDQRGSEVIKGNLLVIPVKGCLIYVQPIYLKAEGGKIPELKRVIVAYENRIAMEENLSLALEKIFKGEVKDSNPIGKITEKEINLIQQAKEYYQNALVAQQKGDWALYGEEIKKLGEVIDKLK